MYACLQNFPLGKHGASRKEVGVSRELTYEGVFFKFDMSRNEKPLLVARGTCNKITDTRFICCKQVSLHLILLLYLTSKSARHCGSSTTSVPTIKYL